jgi:hypothetical protein
VKRLLASLLALGGIASTANAGEREELRQLQAMADNTHRKLVAEGKAPGGQESTDSWVAARENGYVNCVLTVLAEGTKDSVTFSQGERLPNVKSLAAGNTSLEAWASRLAFPYSELSTDKVIGILAKSFELQNSDRGKLKTIVVKNDGSPLAVIFHAEKITSGLKVSVVRAKE